MTRRARTYWLVIGATLLAAWARYYALLTLPPQAWVDEIWFALRARDLLHDPQLILYYKTFWGGVHPFLVWLTAGAQLLGFSSSIVASRAITATAGVISVPLLYVTLAEMLHGHPARRVIAALAALIFAGHFFAISVSRLGTEPMLAFAAMLISVWQLSRAARTRDWRTALLAGLAIGLAQYIGPHARFILPLVVWIGARQLVASPRQNLRAHFGRLALAALSATLAVLPLALFFIREPEWLLGRATYTTIPFTLTALLQNLWRILLSFNFVGDPNLRENIPGRPLLDALQSMGVWVGLGWAIINWRRARAALDLLFWLSLMVLPSLITQDAPAFERMVGALAPLVALVALGWWQLWQHSQPRFRHTTHLALLAVGLSLAHNLSAYFVIYQADPDLARSHTATPVTLAYELRDRAQTEPVLVEQMFPAGDLTQTANYLLPATDVFAFDFLFQDTPVRRVNFQKCLPLAAGRAARTTYLVLTAHDHTTVDTLQRAFPSATVSVTQTEVAALSGAFTLVEIPPGATPPPPAQVTPVDFGSIQLAGYDWSGPSIKAGESLFITLYWRATTSPTEDLIRFMHVGGKDAASLLAGQRDGEPCDGFYPTSQWQIGELIPDGFAITFAADTPPGRYPVAVGWYRYPALERLPLLAAADPLPDGRAIIGEVVITAP